MKDEIRYEVDYSQEESLRNWIVTFELECKPKYYLGFTATCYFAGYILSTFFVLPFSDYVGRKRIMILSYSVYAAFLFFSLFLKGESGYQIFNLLNFMSGTAAAGYFLVSYYHTLESIESKRGINVASSVRAFVSLSALFSAFFFYVVSNDWKHLFICNLIIILTLTIAAQIYLVESPRYLFSSCKW
jgi:MFS family permease